MVNKTVRITLVITCLLLTVMSLILIGIGIFAPAWFTVDVNDYNQYWEIGLWLYCRRGGIVQQDIGAQNFNNWVCDTRDMYPTAKNTVQLQYGNTGTFTIADHHELAVLICLCITFFFLLISLFALYGAYFNRYIPIVLLFTNLLAAIAAMIGVSIYLFSMQSVNARRFYTFNEVHMLQFGYATFCAVAGIILCFVNFVISIPMTIFTLAWFKTVDQERKLDQQFNRSNRLYNDQMLSVGPEAQAFLENRELQKDPPSHIPHQHFESSGSYRPPVVPPKPSLTLREQVETPQSPTGFSYINRDSGAREMSLVGRNGTSNNQFRSESRV